MHSLTSLTPKNECRSICTLQFWNEWRSCFAQILGVHSWVALKRVALLNWLLNGTLLNLGKRYYCWSVAKVALMFGCAKHHKNLKRYLLCMYYNLRACVLCIHMVSGILYFFYLSYSVCILFKLKTLKLIKRNIIAYFVRMDLSFQLQS